ncbi:MAG TPA: hypothetical protein VJ997_12690 [Longimicrobiales bacterium]|nr:hypothetical protein [Longimicrobiales bacterium]
MNKTTSNLLSVLATAVIVSPFAASFLNRSEAPAPAPAVRSPQPAPVRVVTDPVAWFQAIRPRCTPADVTLSTDLNRPPKGVQGTGYEAACFALAHRIPKARAILLGLPEDDRIRGASIVYDVAEDLATRGKHDMAGPLMELVLEFWPNHYLALYEAGSARFASGDLAGAQNYLTRFLEVNEGNEDLVANAQRMIGDYAER